MIVALILAAICLASAVIFVYGGDFLNGSPAAVAVCALAIMGITASHLILRRH